MADAHKTRKKPVRKVYTHVMSERERWALGVVQKCENGLYSVKESLKTGKQVSPALIGLCSDLEKEIARVLFGDTTSSGN